ncbi:MAG: hypothetical protein ABSA82_02885 [Thermacetogeniaceae bacterium]|jgi:hypothetical protein
MSISKEKMLGEQILAKIDHLIESLIAAELRSPQESRQSFDEGCQLVAQLFDLLEQFIGPHPEYLETAVKELVNQRIPDQRLLNGFSGFNTLLDEMCKRADSSDLKAQRNEHDADAEGPVSKDQVERALDLLFPRETVWKRHRYNGVYFDYFLPSLKIAVEESGYQRTENALKEFLCRRDGIRVATVDHSLPGYREIARQIKRQLAAPPQP